MYTVTFQLTLDMTIAQADEIGWANDHGPYELREVITLCADLGCAADLYDAAGLRKGWVHADGTYTLS